MERLGGVCWGWEVEWVLGDLGVLFACFCLEGDWGEWDGCGGCGGGGDVDIWVAVVGTFFWGICLGIYYLLRSRVFRVYEYYFSLK